MRSRHCPLVQYIPGASVLFPTVDSNTDEAYPTCDFDYFALQSRIIQRGQQSRSYLAFRILPRCNKTSLEGCD